ncbi:MAG: small-conductance mechanosensitive channel [Candidatus Paceibacteria bacterium]|jgi:small-conductance mechanosensitive channel
MENIIKTLEPWFNEHGLKILAILLVGIILKKVANFFIDKLTRKLIRSDMHISQEAEEKREETIIQIFNGTFSVILWLVVTLMIISEFGIDIAPLIAGAGVIGLAVGFGAQYLIRDIVTGLFIILENQYRVGDTIDIGGKGGTVEDVSLRVTVIRDLDGTLHYVPHGEISTVSNKSKIFSRVNMDIGVSYDADIDHVEKVVNKVGEELAKDPEFSDKITKAPKFLRVNELADSSVMIKILGETKPQRQWEVSGELRKRLKNAFDKEGIEIPFPQVVVKQK